MRIEVTSIQQRLLALLEEAGEETISALVNSVGQCNGSPSELDIVIESLISLTQQSLVCCASRRDEKTLKWIPINPTNSHALLAKLRENIRWFPDERLWKWDVPTSPLVVLLTDAGLQKARKLLATHGWELVKKK